jgi:hypothetical protein
VSGYSWGSTVFHYGRWFRHARHGWCWWPDTVWAPSWVCWRYDRSYCGWAPLPPFTVYRSGIGVVYRDRHVGAGFDFELSAGSFTFVAIEYFCDPKPWRHRIQSREAELIYRRTTVMHNIGYDPRERRIRNAGIPPHDISAASGREIQTVPVRPVKGSASRAGDRVRIEPAENRSAVNRREREASRPSAPPASRRTGQHPDVNGRPHTGRPGSGQTFSENRKSDLHTPRSGSPPPSRSKTPPPQIRESHKAPRKPVQTERAAPAPKAKQPKTTKASPPSRPWPAEQKPAPGEKK